MHPHPLAQLTPEELAHKVHALLEDWPSPTLSPIGLCRAHDVTLMHISAIRQLPMFNDILDHIEEIQHHRRPHIEQRARDLALDRLCYLAHQTPTSAASCKEIRLATKAILDLVGPTPSRPSDSVTPPMQSPDSDSPGGTARRAVSSESPSDRAPSVSDGVFREPEAPAPGLPNQPRPEGSGSTDANEPETSTTQSINECSPTPTRSVTPNPHHSSPTLTPNSPASDPNTSPPPAQTTTPTPSPPFASFGSSR